MTSAVDEGRFSLRRVSPRVSPTPSIGFSDTDTRSRMARLEGLSVFAELAMPKVSETDVESDMVLVDL